MNQLDVYYRALKDYRVLTESSRECTAFRKAIASADPENDSILITRNTCTVDEDWIIEIEKGLIFIEKAIKEERQFIYSNGEVLPIEKVKHIGKESVVHLAKHSNLITREQEGDEIIPDQLYSVERLNDYAVYENRFLYMLLCYLRDFVTIRYNKILDLSNKYDGVLKINKEIALPKQKITYSVDLHEERKDDKYLRENNPSKDIIDRIDLILKTILAFLATPLMEIAGKAAKLKPPITKTNILKMDKNFKGAVALYDYIIAYEKPGYSVESNNVELSPFSEALADEISEAGALLSFLMYEYGLGLNEALKISYKAEEERRKAERIKQKEEQLEVLKRKLSNLEETPEEYILALEKHIKLLQNEGKQLEPLRAKINDLKEKEVKLCSEIDSLKDESQMLKKQISENEKNHLKEMEDLRVDCNERIHQNLIRHDKELRELERDFGNKLEEIKTQMREMENELNGEIEETLKKLSDSDQTIEKMSAERADLVEENRLAEARIKALRRERGDKFSDEEYTDKDSFDELERELEAFVKFYDERWGITKKKIRKKLLNYKSLKEQKE